MYTLCVVRRSGKHAPGNGNAGAMRCDAMCMYIHTPPSGSPSPQLTQAGAVFWLERYRHCFAITDAVAEATVS